MKFLLLFFIALSYINYGSLTYCNPRLAEAYSEELAKLQKETCDELNAPGAVLYVRFKDGSVWNHAYGYAVIDGDKSKKLNSDMQFRIASVTKTFIATAILKLVGEKKFLLDDSVDKLLPGLVNFKKKITVEMLLDHSSAIPDYATTDKFTEKYINNFSYNWSAGELFDFIKNYELLDDPGREGYYSNTNYYILGMLIEKYSQKPLHQYLKENIFNPLGLKNTYFPIENELNGNFSKGYFDFNNDGKFDKNEAVDSQNPSAIWASGMIVSNVHDLSIWINELFHGTLTKPELQKKRLFINKKYHGAPDFVKIGLGIANIDGAVGHTGAIPGFTSIIFRYKGADIIVLSNCFHTKEGMGSVAEKIFENVKTKVIDKI